MQHGREIYPRHSHRVQAGLYKLNDEPHINYQFNRTINWDGGDLEEVRAVGPGIKTFADWKRELTGLGRAAEAQGRTRAAFGYFLVGGYLAPRAAAFDKRISRVVGWSIYPGTHELVQGGYSKGILRFLRGVLKVRFFDPLINGAERRGAAKGNLAAQTMVDMCHPYGAKSVCDMFRKMCNYTLSNCADKVDQDILILGADEDIYIVPSLAGMELDELTHTKSLALRMFKTAEQAGNHCNVGDTKLALDTIIDWMRRLDVRDSVELSR